MGVSMLGEASKNAGWDITKIYLEVCQIGMPETGSQHGTHPSIGHSIGKLQFSEIYVIYDPGNLRKIA